MHPYPFCNIYTGHFFKRPVSAATIADIWSPGRLFRLTRFSSFCVSSFTCFKQINTHSSLFVHQPRGWRVRLSLLFKTAAAYTMNHICHNTIDRRLCHMPSLSLFPVARRGNYTPCLSGCNQWLVHHPELVAVKHFYTYCGVNVTMHDVASIVFFGCRLSWHTYFCGHALCWGHHGDVELWFARQW